MSLSSRSILSKLAGYAHLGGTNADLVCRRFCNGGSLSGLIQAYEKRLIPIPEHFVWYIKSHVDVPSFAFII